MDEFWNHLKLHLLHLHNQVTICHSCDKKFESPQEFMKHFTEHPTEYWRDPFLSKTKNTSSTKTKGIKIVNGKTVGRCSCDAKFDSVEACIDHIEEIVNNEPTAADEEEGSDKKEKASADDIKSKGMLDSCVYCLRHHPGDKMLPHLLKVHAPQAHSGVKQCENCDSTFETTKLLLRHLRVHRRKKIKYDCPNCHQVFNYGAWYFHKDVCGRAEDADKQEFLCDECGFKAASRPHLVKHIYRHHNAKKGHFKCKECDKSYSKGSALKAHVQGHHRKEGDPLFVCHICGKSYTVQKNMRDHITRVHETEKVMYHCKGCKETFRFARNFNRHVLAHWPEFEYFQCTTCHNKFSRHAEIESHIKDMHHGMAEILTSDEAKAQNLRETLAEKVPIAGRGRKPDPNNTKKRRPRKKGASAASSSAKKPKRKQLLQQQSDPVEMHVPPTSEQQEAQPYMAVEQHGY